MFFHRWKRVEPALDLHIYTLVPCWQLTSPKFHHNHLQIVFFPQSISCAPQSKCHLRTKSLAYFEVYLQDIQHEHH
jgi:hypothetical protein